MAQTNDIWVGSWGYNMTIVDFYVVVSATPKTVTLQRIKAVKAEGAQEGYLAGYVVPASPIVHTVERRSSRFRRKLNLDSIGEFAYGDPHGQIRPWNGEPVWFNHCD